MVYVIVGPTASGKSEVASSLLEKKNAPIINADAFQIYKDMDIGTAKVSPTDPSYSHYYLLDIVDPSTSYSVAEYQKDFREIFETLLKDNKDIIIVGGTGLYIRAALYDYNFPEESLEDEDYSELTNEEIYAILEQKDPDSLKNIHVNNRKRLLRALNILNKQSMTKSENIASQKHELYRDDIEVKFLFINPDRDELYRKINERVDLMFERGLVDEVKSLLQKYSLSNTASQAIGYKEVISYLNGEISLEECKELIKKRTRNYAKRQVTYFRHQLPCIEFKNGEDLLKEII
ncbi:MAG: tRNA (adenosine(37)-N6)-dimethylallyltransferase MiaA [Coprobacillus sp.]|nr:tRNA (adenosine(37)-N6)-dimethylallyltransferase MiaA [Coprobacillus sp.]